MTVSVRAKHLYYSIKSPQTHHRLTGGAIKKSRATYYITPYITLDCTGIPKPLLTEIAEKKYSRYLYFPEKHVSFYHVITIKFSELVQPKDNVSMAARRQGGTGNGAASLWKGE